MYPSATSTPKSQDTPHTLGNQSFRVTRMMTSISEAEVAAELDEDSESEDAAMDDNEGINETLAAEFFSDERTDQAKNPYDESIISLPYKSRIEAYLPLDEHDFTSTEVTKHWKKHWRKTIVKEDKMRFDQDVIYTLFACNLSPDKTDCTAGDITEQEGSLDLERALRLLHRLRFGQEDTKLRITPHIDYNNFRGDQAKTINSSVATSLQTLGRKQFLGLPTISWLVCLPEIVG